MEYASRHLKFGAFDGLRSVWPWRWWWWLPPTCALVKRRWWPPTTFALGLCLVKEEHSPVRWVSLCWQKTRYLERAFVLIKSCCLREKRRNQSHMRTQRDMLSSHTVAIAKVQNLIFEISRGSRIGGQYHSSHDSSSLTVGFASIV